MSTLEGETEVKMEDQKNEKETRYGPCLEDISEESEGSCENDAETFLKSNNGEEFQK